MAVEMRTHEIIFDALQSTAGGFQRGPQAIMVVEWAVGGPSTPCRGSQLEYLGCRVRLGLGLDGQSAAASESMDESRAYEPSRTTDLVSSVRIREGPRSQPRHPSRWPIPKSSPLEPSRMTGLVCSVRIREAQGAG